MFKDYCNYRDTVEIVENLLSNGVDPLKFASKAKKIVEANGNIEDIDRVIAELSFDGVKNWFTGGTKDDMAYGNKTTPNAFNRMAGQKAKYGQPVDYSKFQSAATQNFQVNKDKEGDFNKALQYLHALLQPLKNLGFNISNIQAVIEKVKAKAGKTVMPTATPEPTKLAPYQQPLDNKYTGLTKGTGMATA